MMKLKLTLLIVATLVACATSWSCTESDWEKYKEEYNKNYDSAEIDLYHKNTFCENLVNIIQNNQDYEIGEVNHKLAVTTFTDLSPTEQEEYRKSHGFKRRRGGSRVKPIQDEEELE